MQYIRQGATHKVVIGPVVAVANGYVPVTTLSLASADEAEVILHDNGTVVDISGYTFAAITTADGYYHLTLQSGISNTVGHMTVVINDDSLCLPVKAQFTVVEEAVYDALFASSALGYVANAPVNVTQFGGSSTAAARAAQFWAAARLITVDDATFTPTTSVFETDQTTDDADRYSEQVLYGLDGDNQGYTVRITGYTFANSKVKLTVDTLPAAPADGERFILLGRIEQ